MKRIIMTLLLIGCSVGATFADTGDGGYSSCDVCYSSRHSTGSYKCFYRCENCASQWHRTGSSGCPKTVALSLPASQTPIVVPQPQPHDEEATNFAASSIGSHLLRSKDVIKKWKNLTLAEHVKIDSSEFRAVLNNFRAYTFKNAIVIGQLFTTYCCQVERAIVMREVGKRSPKKLSRISTALVEIFNCMYAVREAYIHIDADDVFDFDDTGILKLLSRRITYLEKLCSKRRLRVKKDSCVAVDGIPSAALNFCAE